MKFKLENPQHQITAIRSVVEVFRGMEKNTYDNAHNEDIHSNVCSLTSQELADNIKRVIEENNIPESQSHITTGNDACIEMETGTGKTLTYIQTAYELNKEYGLTKFIVLVPSVPIRQGVIDTIDNFKEQLDQLGFKVFTLSKSSFPRVDFAPDPTKNEDENLELFNKYIAEKEQQLSLAFNNDELITEILITRGFMLTYKLERQPNFTANEVYLATDGIKTAYICVDNKLEDATVDYFMEHTDTKFICIERALDSTKKFNLKKKMEDKFFAF